jgi:hypothetical protein
VNTKTGQADGACKPVTANTDPDNECPQEATSTCGMDGMCDGLGACRKWSAGITCVTQACSGTTYTPARVCNGSGACQTVSNASCAPFICGAMTCKTVCADDNDCSTGNFCSGTACVALKGMGAACAGSNQCASGYCVDGFCCESSCSSGCFACSNAKTGQGDGFCKPITSGTDPDNECPQDTPSSCGLDGQCDGTGQCRRWTGTVCVSESCSGMTYTPARTCNGSGVCQTVTSTTCGAYTCGATACKNMCTTNLDCATGYFCAGNQCVTLHDQGGPCTMAAECRTGACVDGVCCENSCAGGCMACSNAKTTQADGLCRAVIGGTDPDNDCSQDPSSTCGQDGMCDGAGGCRKYTFGTVCVGESCTGATYTPARTCDGAGACQLTVGASCMQYVCGATACLSTCVNNNDCNTGYHCAAGVCVVKETNGTACLVTGDCMSGNCVDGVCCDTACNGTCQTCSATNSLGTCKNADPGTNPRSECSASAASTCGTDGFCDGAGACRMWAAGTVCAPAGCANAMVSTASTCNGTGTCSAGISTSCGAYQCSGAVCGTSCTTDAACTGFCAAGACSAKPANLAGNGDLEYGTNSGWTTNGGVTLALQNAGTAPANVHSGTYAIADTGRTANFHGPAYTMPTGAGVYNVTAWVMQNSTVQDTTLNAVLNVGLTCGSSTGANHFPSIGPSSGFNQFPIAPGVWTKITGTIDFAAQGADCQPNAATPGVVKNAVLYVNQNGAGTPTAQPDLYMDDVVITATDGHNLVGNPNFEAGVTNGWQNNGGGTLATTTAIFLGGTHSLAHTGRTATFQGPRWNLPIGAAKYNLTFNALHDGTMNHDLILQPTYTCNDGMGARFPASVAIASQVGGMSWNTLSGTYTMPPANAPAGCKMISAAVYLQQEFGNGSCTGVECPNLYVDDVSITLVP